jgi:hypothetical protein
MGPPSLGHKHLVRCNRHRRVEANGTGTIRDENRAAVLGRLMEVFNIHVESAFAGVFQSSSREDGRKKCCCGK